MLEQVHPNAATVVKVRLCNDHMTRRPPLATGAAPSCPPHPPLPRNSRNIFLANKVIKNETRLSCYIAFDFLLFQIFPIKPLVQIPSSQPRTGGRSSPSL